MRHNGREGTIKKRSRTVHLLPALIVIVGIIACSLCAAISTTYWDFLGLIIIISLASLLTGAIFGFLFGIPRLNKNYDPREDYDRTTKYNPNTNLEDVSDWLTKIIIGVTLTQLTKIPDHLRSIADYILINSNCEILNCDFARPILISVIIYFIIAGFIIGYFYTRLYLPNLFSIMEDNKMKKAEISIWRAGAGKEMHPTEGKGTESKIAPLTKDEILILKKIKSQNNRFAEQQRISLHERAALNVLLSKGIVETVQEDSPGQSAALRIVDKDLLNGLD